MLITRSIYLADVFAPYPYMVYWTFKTLPVVFIVQAGAILAFLLRKLHLLFQEATCDLTRAERKLYVRQAKHRMIFGNSLYFVGYLILLIITASKAVSEYKCWIVVYCSEIIVLTFVFVMTLIRGHQLQNYLKITGIGSPQRLQLVTHFFSFAMLARAIADVLLLFSWIEKNDQKDVMLGWWWQNVLVVMYILLDIVPLFIILFVIKFRSDLQEEECNRSSVYQQLDQYQYGDQLLGYGNSYLTDKSSKN